MQYLAGLGVYIGHPPGPGRSNHSEIRFVIGLETGLDSNSSQPRIPCDTWHCG